jgi:hypothetical protein
MPRRTCPEYPSAVLLDTQRDGGGWSTGPVQWSWWVYGDGEAGIVVEVAETGTTGRRQILYLYRAELEEAARIARESEDMATVSDAIEGFHLGLWVETPVTGPELRLTDLLDGYESSFFEELTLPGVDWQAPRPPAFIDVVEA